METSLWFRLLKLSTYRSYEMKTTPPELLLPTLPYEYLWIYVQR
jgi:hypothetical protein